MNYLYCNKFREKNMEGIRNAFWKSIKRSLFSLGSFYLTHETDNTTSVK